MKPSLLDTDTLSFFFKRHPSVVSSLEAYSRQYGRVNLSIITYYEILSGLNHRDANKKLEVFLDFAAQNTVLSLTEEAATIASEYYATLFKQGQPLEDIDLLIAGIALSNNLVLVTHNTKHFERIEGLEIADWTLDFQKRTENAER
ncbi:MAG: type II toxin-antitoxin system VapC family toxin [Desulfobacteria bacterium]